MGAAGCGGGGEATPAVTKAEFIRQAKKICDKANEKVNTEGAVALQEIEQNGGGSGGQAEVELVSQWLGPLVDTEVAELRALGAPRGDEDRLNAMYQNLEEVADLAKSNPKRYLYEQANFKRPYQEAEDEASAYGIPRCGQP